VVPAGVLRSGEAQLAELMAEHIALKKVLESSDQSLGAAPNALVARKSAFLDRRNWGSIQSVPEIAVRI
jgi:hypothetical protein